MYTSLMASINSTIAEECIVLIRKLHPLPAWKKIMNSLIGTALQNIPELVLQSEFTSLEKTELELNEEIREKQVLLPYIYEL